MPLWSIWAWPLPGGDVVGAGGGDGGLVALLGCLLPGGDQPRQPGGLEAHAGIGGGDQGTGGRRDRQVAPAADIGARLDDRAVAAVIALEDDLRAGVDGRRKGLTGAVIGLDSWKLCHAALSEEVRTLMEGTP